MMKKTIYLFLIMFIINIAVDFLVSDSLAQEADIQETSTETATLDDAAPSPEQEVNKQEASSEAFTLDDTDPSPVPTFDIKKSLEVAEELQGRKSVIY